MANGGAKQLNESSDSENVPDGRDPSACNEQSTFNDQSTGDLESSIRTVGGTVIEAVYRRGEDRFQHGIRGRIGEDPAWLLQSCEGDGLQDWPCSPPIQQLVAERLPDGSPALLGVGMAGKSHWSASIHRGDSNDGILFDFACRFSLTPKFLGSSYRIHPQSEYRWSSSRLVIRLDHLAVEVQVLGQARLAVDEDRVLVIKPLVDPNPFPATARWCYRMRPIDD